MIRAPLRTTLDEDLLNFLRFKALELRVDMNDILESLVEKYRNGEVQIEPKRKRGEKS